MDVSMILVVLKSRYGRIAYNEAGVCFHALYSLSLSGMPKSIRATA